MASHANQSSLFLTVLPNGLTSDGHARFTVLLTPSVTSDLYQSPFANWPASVGNPTWQVNWQLLTTPPTPGIPPALSAKPVTQSPCTPDGATRPLDSKLWTNIFGTTRSVQPRTGNSKLNASWHLSHDISTIHKKHEATRLFHAHKRLLAQTMYSIRQASAANLGTLGTLATSVQNAFAAVQNAIDATTGPVLFLYPSLGNDNQAYIIQSAAGTAAQNYRQTTIDTAVFTKPSIATTLKNRIDHAIHLLESDGEKLLDVALYYIYLHCIKSMSPKAFRKDAGAPQGDDATLFALFDTVHDNYTSGGGSDNLLKSVGPYIELLMYHRREPHPAILAQQPPDFHQLLGLVNHYPSMLRVLGLAFDLIAPNPGPGDYMVSVTPWSGNGPAPIGTLTPVCNSTYCRVVDAEPANHSYSGSAPVLADFVATPTDLDPTSASIQDRMLRIGQLPSQAPSAAQPNPPKVANGNFLLVSQDADGAALKHTDQVNSTARGKQYASSAPTSMNPPPSYIPTSDTDINQATPAAVPDPTDAPAAPRTIGISLLHSNKLDQIEGVTARQPAPATVGSTTPSTFFADDLILGYRVDVRYRGTWYSLCARSSTYKVVDIDNPNHVVYDAWAPTTDIEKSSDEGYVTFAATQSDVGSSGDTQTQIHQTVWTWPGWLLSVPRPTDFPVFDPQPTPDPSVPQLSIFPTYTVVTKTRATPPLRFCADYDFGCRIVDLAGNSPAVTAMRDDSTIGTPLTKFSRVQPYRAPQFLLTSVIDRTNHPGEHIDHMVARDNDQSSSRVLVAPRESLRLAELSGVLKDANLPPSSFYDFQLQKDGSFPCIDLAIDEGWVDGETGIKGQTDAIFLPHATDRPENPFYPDPDVRFVRIDATIVSDTAGIGKPLGSTVSTTMVGDTWTDSLPVRVRLTPVTQTATASIEAAQSVAMTEHGGPDFGQKIIQEINVNVPSGQTVILSISSTNTDPNSATADLCDVHLARLHELFMNSFVISKGTTLSTDQITMAATDLGLVADASGINHGALALQQVSAFANANRIAFLPVTSKADPSVALQVTSFVDGSLGTMSPARTMTLVHAVKQPIEQADFASPGNGDLSVLRQFGAAPATVTGGLQAHWLSTGKIACHATWTDTVDDPKKAGLVESTSNEVAFEVTPDTMQPLFPHYDSFVYLRALPAQLLHAFRDTRAHKVTYSLKASTRFRDYYAKNIDAKEFQTDGLTTREVTVLSSVRPPAPSIAYIIPAFEWRETDDPKTKTWFSGRVAFLRIYLSRPFKISGNLEGIAIALASKSNSLPPKDQQFVTRWGADPTRDPVTMIKYPEMNSKDFCPVNDAAYTCILAEKIQATDNSKYVDVRPYPVTWAPDRQLWFADIPVKNPGSYAPFIKLAIARWQPDALHDDTDDARISQIVFADFIQLSVDRWVSIERRDATHYTITVSGIFTAPANPDCSVSNSKPTFQCEVYSRWYALTQDTGWRKVDSSLNFCYTAPMGDNSISSWSAELHLSESTSTRKYRILLREKEWFTNSPLGRMPYEQFIDLP